MIRSSIFNDSFDVVSRLSIIQNSLTNQWHKPFYFEVIQGIAGKVIKSFLPKTHISKVPFFPNCDNMPQKLTQKVFLDNVWTKKKWRTVHYSHCIQKATIIPWFEVRIAWIIRAFPDVHMRGNRQDCSFSINGKGYSLPKSGRGMTLNMRKEPTSK